MSDSNNNQDYTTIIYKLDEVKKTFCQYKKQSEEKSFLPEFLRIEKNNGYNSFSGRNNLLRLRDVSNWSLCTQLGLNPSGINYFYHIDLWQDTIKVLCIVHYPREAQYLKMILFHTFYPCPKIEYNERIKDVLNSIAHTEGA